MKDLACDLRFLQLYAHNAHNLCKGPTFFQDHEFLGELYPKYESDYDSVIERMIGLGMAFDINLIQKQAVESLMKVPQSYEGKAVFSKLLSFEKYLCLSIQKEVSGCSEGTKQLLGEIANQSEMRQYKMKQRISS